MPTNVLANGTTSTTAETAIAAGSVVSLKSASMVGGRVPAGALIVIELKDDVGGYIEVDRLSQKKPSVILSGAGTYRFTRAAGVNVGVFLG